MADEVLRLDGERRRQEDEGEEVMWKKPVKLEIDKKRVVARTRVSSRYTDTVFSIVDSIRPQLQFTPDEINQYKSMGMAPRRSARDGHN